MEYIVKPHRVRNSAWRVFTQNDLDYIVQHHKTKNVKELVNDLQFSFALIYRYMKMYDLKPKQEVRVKPYIVENLKHKIVDVLEDYANTFDTIDNISKRHNTSKYAVAKWISDYYIGKPKTEETIIIILKSKI